VSHSNCEPDAVAFTDPERESSGNEFADANAVTYAERQPNAIADAVPFTQPDGKQLADSYGLSNADCVVDTNSVPDSHLVCRRARPSSVVLIERDSDGQSNSDTYAERIADADPFFHAHCQLYTDPQQHSDGFAYADTEPNVDVDDVRRARSVTRSASQTQTASATLTTSQTMTASQTATLSQTVTASSTQSRTLSSTASVTSSPSGSSTATQTQTPSTSQTETCTS